MGLAQARREKSAREWRDIEQEEIAEYVGVTRAAYSRWEKGERSPRDPEIKMLARYFEVDPAELSYRKVEPGQPQPSTPDLRDLVDETTAKRVSEPSVGRSKRAAAKKGRGGSKKAKRASGGRG